MSYPFVEYVSHGWVYVQAGIAIPAVVMILGMGFIPESPKWLVQHNRLADAKDTLRHLRPKAHDIDAEVIRTSLVM
jgi:hypothetical protein